MRQAAHDLANRLVLHQQLFFPADAKLSVDLLELHQQLYRAVRLSHRRDGAVHGDLAPVLHRHQHFPFRVGLTRLQGDTQIPFNAGPQGNE